MMPVYETDTPAILYPISLKSAAANDNFVR